MPENQQQIEKKNQAIIQSVAHTMESFAFMEVIISKEKTPYDENLERLRAEILINEPLPGEIRLIMPKDLVLIIAENIYVMEKEDINDELMLDILSEMANVIAGNIMTNLYKKEDSFKLGLPDVGQEAYLDIDLNSDAVEFDMEGHPFWLVLMGEVFS